MNTVKFLFWLGIFVMFLGVLATVITDITLYTSNIPRVGFNFITGLSGSILSIVGTLSSGGMLIGLSKILEHLYNKEKSTDDVRDFDSHEL